MLRKTPLALALGMAWGITPVVALAQQTTTPDTEVTRLNEVTVSSTRTERRVDNVPNTVTVTTKKSIEEKNARDLKDAFSEELDVSVRTAPSRFTAAGAATGRAGSEGINIRGLEGNRVLMLVDGIRLPNSFSFASFSTGRGDFLDVDGLKSAEILRGPSSTQYGSDGIAGAVSFRTLDPSDLLKPGSNFNGFVRGGYASVDNSWNGTLAGAGKSGGWQGLLLTSYRQGNEVENKGSDNSQNANRTKPNPLDYDNSYALGKVAYAITPTQQLGLTFETQNRKQATEVYSGRSVPPLTAASVIDLDTDDQIRRDRVSLEHRYTDLNGSWLQRAETRLYWQDATVQQFSAEDRLTSVDRTRDNTYTQKVVGLSTQLESNFTGAVNQRVTYGVDMSQSDFTGVRDGTVPPFGETFPTKPFPDTEYTLLGAFVQDEIELGKFSVIPGLRFDSYKLTPSSDGYVGAATTLSDQAVTPRLGVVWRLVPAFAPYAQYSQGFRAPTPDEVNNGFTNLASGYKSVGNPDLKPEHADSFEAGFRGQVAGLRYSLAGYENRYKDFISQTVVSGAGTIANPSVYQYVNYSKARISGWEARSEYAFLTRWTANAGLAYMKGTTETNGITQPLDTIQPLKAVGGLRFDDAAWGARATVTYSAAKKQSDTTGIPVTSTTTTPAYATPAWTILDLGAYWKPTRNLSIFATLNNVFDKKYWRWSDTRGLADNSTIKDAYTAPGRNASISARYDF
ncbi:TonB-dependent hemoglobin/transferrin/lactoferrin family receptor [Uliginosibacterium sp. H3]|uniref:TonB-dependent hemoglobin/transferrin/lactoferrin family receptor n=1 Tax=Uliginosibacterium silvisoli TaxID=3114758 RepID=A0ABU6K1Y8_9RHOO|nr:TonB-dependent hemoglobin/transferrin/lactoferrin family receptor [Uliginosibacterium sp. H3]